MVLAAISLVAISGFEVGRCDEKEDRAITRLEKLGGTAARSSQSLFLYLTDSNRSPDLTDDDMIAVDFDALKRTNGLLLIGRKLTDRSLIEISKISELERLIIGKTKITDKGFIDFLGKRSALNSVSLHGTPLTDAITPRLGKMSELNFLDLRDNNITDKGAKEIAQHGGLVSLDLSLTFVSDACLADIAKMEKLQYLTLYGTKVTDDGIKQLAPMKNLRRLGVTSTKVTPAGKAWLQEKIPGLVFVK